MVLLLSKFEVRCLGALLAVLILFGSISTLSGVCIVSGTGRPQVTLDVCHPLQAFSVVSKVLLAHPDSGGMPEPVLQLQGTISEHSTHRLIDLCFAPDPPPPKALS